MPEENFVLLHVDDDPKDLEEFAEFISSAGRHHFTLHSEERPTLALARLAERNEICLCIVDLELDDQVTSEFNDTVWDGFGFVSLGKILSPSTNFIVLSNRVGPYTKTRAAEAGCFGVLPKRRLTDSAALQVIEQLEYACLYSQHFLRFQSEARLNFSNAIAHTLRRELRKWRNDLKLIKEYGEGGFTNDQLILMDNAISDNDMIEAKLERVLKFYTRDKITPEDIEIKDVLNEIFYRCGLDNNCHLVIDPNLSIARLDPQLLSIALENLIENARKAIIHLGPAGRIEITALLKAFKSGAQYLQINISDNGVGLSPGEEQLALKPNYSGENLAGRGVSFGIGCAEAAKIARLHWNRDMSGSLKLASGPDGLGCCATLVIPLIADNTI